MIKSDLNETMIQGAIDDVTAEYCAITKAFYILLQQEFPEDHKEMMAIVGRIALSQDKDERKELGKRIGKMIAQRAEEKYNRMGEQDGED